jgi:hypothetical protein
MTIITQDYVLRTKEDLPLLVQRQAMSQFEFSFGCAISAAHTFEGSTKSLGYLSVQTLFPEHNGILHPILLAKQVQTGVITEQTARAEGNLRRIYQLGRSSLSLRCIPDFEKQIDELQFIFSGALFRDLKPSINAISGLVNEVNKLNHSALEWYKQ